MLVGGAQSVASRHIPESQDIPFGMQAPASHSAQLSMPSVHEVSPQRVPGPLLPPSAQIGAPVEHEIVPVLQALLGLSVHAMPAMQSTHAPALLQTLLTPQLAPASFCSWLSQTVDPLLQLVMPLKQGSGLPVQL